MVRIKNRYLAIQLIPESKSQTTILKDYLLYKCILENVHKYYGDYGLGLIQQGFKVKYCNRNTRIAIVRCLHSSYQYVTSILPLIVLVGDIRAKIRIIYIGATILQCNKYIVKHHEKYLDRMLEHTKALAERKEIIKNIMEFDLNN